jgi:hypothetical protein
LIYTPGAPGVTPAVPKEKVAILLRKCSCFSAELCRPG